MIKIESSIRRRSTCLPLFLHNKREFSSILIWSFLTLFISILPNPGSFQIFYSPGKLNIFLKKPQFLYLGSRWNGNASVPAWGIEALFEPERDLWVGMASAESPTRPAVAFCPGRAGHAQIFLIKRGRIKVWGGKGTFFGREVLEFSF